MQERKQFTFYSSFWDSIRELPAKYQLPALRAIICYALFQEEPTNLPPTCRAVFLLVKPTLDSSRKKAANGSRGGQSGKQSESKPEAKQEQPAREKEREKEKEIEVKKEVEVENNKRSAPQQSSPGKMAAQSSEEGRAQFDGKSFTAFWDAYPCKIGRDAAWDEWRTISPNPEVSARIHAALQMWKSSDQWKDEGGRYIPRAAKFLIEKYWESPPSDNQSGITVRQMDDDEKAAVQRMLHDDISLQEVST